MGKSKIVVYMTVITEKALKRQLLCPAHLPGHRLYLTVALSAAQQEPRKVTMGWQSCSGWGVHRWWHGTHSVVSHQMIVLWERTGEREGRCNWMSSMLLHVPLKRWGVVEILPTLFSMSNYSSEKGIFEYAVQKSGIRRSCLRVLQISFWTCFR